jgi:hypothetical protein
MADEVKVKEDEQEPISTQTPPPDTASLPKDFLDELDGAVCGVVETVERERAQRIAAREIPAKSESKDKPEPKQDLPPTEVQDGDGKGAEAPTGVDKEKKADEGGQPPELIPDALVERAIKAGMSISDARSFKKADALERVTGILEKRRVAGDQEAAGDDKKDEADDPLAAIPDLDPEKYDEGVVNVVKALKDVIRKQNGVIQGLHSDGKARNASWFDSQVATLGEAYVEAVGDGNRSKMDPNSPQAKKVAELESKFKVLSAGYKAAGAEINNETVFEEAVAIVLGDVKAKAETALKGAELEKRKKLHIARPSGAGVKPTTNVEDDVASELDRKYFGKK